MKAASIEFLACAVIAAASFGCGGATEQPVSEPAPPAAEATEDPGDDAGPGEAAAAEAPAEAAAEAPAEAAAEAPAEAAAEAPAEAAAYVGKGVERAVLGSDKGAKGVTNFEHWKHQQSGAKCLGCHHKGAGQRSCGSGADCHKATEVNAPAAKDAFHKACMPCHKKKGLATGCDYCHQPKAGA